VRKKKGGTKTSQSLYKEPPTTDGGGVFQNTTVAPGNRRKVHTKKGRKEKPGASHLERGGRRGYRGVLSGVGEGHDKGFRKTYMTGGLRTTRSGPTVRTQEKRSKVTLPEGSPGRHQV